jgi:hypothetical protein
VARSPVAAIGSAAEPRRPRAIRGFDSSALKKGDKTPLADVVR